MYGVVYKVTNTVNGRFYIGQTITTLPKRWSKHCSDARAGAGWVLAAAIRKYGVGVFSIDVLETCGNKSALNAAEIRWIADLQPVYNSCAGGGGLGAPSLAVRTKISVALKGRQRSAEAIARTAAAQIGRKVSDATKEKLRRLFAGKHLRKTPMAAFERARLAERNKARAVRPKREDLKALYALHPGATRNEKISLAIKHSFAIGRSYRRFGAANPMFGRRRSEADKQRISEQQSGEKNGFYGRAHSDETRAKMRAVHAARPSVACPHCGVEGRSNAMKRWHFNNCRGKA